MDHQLIVRIDSTTPTIHVNVLTSHSSSPDERSIDASSNSSSPQSSPGTPINPPPPSSSALEGRTVASQAPSKTETLESLKDSIPHAMTLTKLEEEEKYLQRAISWHKKSVRRLSKALYQVVSIYALLQGVLFAAVAQTTVFTCASWWGPVFVAVATTLGAFCGVVDKLWSMGKHRENVRRFRARHNAVFDIIDMLRWKGTSFDLDSMEPQHNYLQDREAGYHCVFSAYGLLVLGFLVGFSGLITTSCIQMLCQPCKCT